MKLFNKISLLLLTCLASCAVNDPFADNMELGQLIPTTAWELGSKICKAGTDASFTGKYYFQGKDEMIDHTEMWALIARDQKASATCKLTTKLPYTKSTVLTDTVRNLQLIKSFDHQNLEWNSDKTIGVKGKVYTEDGKYEDSNGKFNCEYIVKWNGYEYILNAGIPTSRTLSPVSWVSPKDWDQEKFDSYYSPDFQNEFIATINEMLTKDSTYIVALREVYLNYDFKKEQFEALNAKFNLKFPTVEDIGEKSDAWFTNTGIVVNQYSITVENGIVYYHELKEGEVKDPNKTYYDVYSSSPWIFCRYSDDTGSAITSIRPEYLPYIKDMISLIPFTSWIYSKDQTYSVDFSRKYKMYPVYKVYGKNNKVGFSTDQKEIELN